MLQNEFKVFAIIATSFRLYFSDLPVIFATSVVVLSPAIVLNILFPTAQVTGILHFVLLSVLVAVLSVRILHRIHGRNNGLLADVKQALGKKSPFLMVSFLSSLAVIIGLVLAIVPGVIIYVMFLIAIPIACLERLSTRECFRRSMALTKGFRWRIFGVVLVQFILVVFVTVAVAVLLFALIDKFMTDEVPLWILLLADGFACLMSGLHPVVITVIYATLRKVKDGVDSEQIAEVFS